MKKDGLIVDGIYGVQPAFEEDQPMMLLAVTEADGVVKHPSGMYSSGRFKDDLTKQPLVDSLVKEARKQEMAYFAQKKVWMKVPRKQCYDDTGKPPISVRWVDVNKGDDQVPKYRSRLVARQIRAIEGNNLAAYFAPAPPLEALRTVLSLARITIGEHRPDLDPCSENRTQISTMDICRAYFNAIKDADDSTYVELPPEDADSGRLVAKLLKHMYGTRAAADGWQEEYSTTLIALGFTQGRASPCLFSHRSRRLYCSVHGDDFTTVGGKRDLDWFEA